MQYITLDSNNKITAVADWQFPDSIPAKEEVVRTEEGQFVFKSELNEEHEQAVRDAREAEQRRQEILAELSEIDSKKVRSASAIALALANGNISDPEDIATLSKYEQNAVVLREELRSLTNEG